MASDNGDLPRQSTLYIWLDKKFSDLYELIHETKKETLSETESLINACKCEHRKSIRVIFVCIACFLVGITFKNFDSFLLFAKKLLAFI